MKAILYEGFGSTDVIQARDVPSPALTPRQVRIAVKASGLNRADLVQRRGKYPAPPGESDIPGLEVSGEVIECGTEAARFKKGDRVMALLGGGGYASEVAVDERTILPMPRHFSFPQGAATMEVFLTAYLNLFLLGGARAGSRALVHAGASGVGTAAVQLLRHAGAEAFVTVSSKDKAQACAALGAKSFLGRDEDFSQPLLEATGGKGVDVILDPVGASYLERNLASLAMEGRIVYIGTMSGAQGNLNLATLMAKRARLIGSTLRPLSIERKGEVVESFEKAFYSALSAQKIRPIIDKTYPVSAVREAQQRMESNANVGKIILSWE